MREAVILNGWSTEVLTESINLLESLQEKVKVEARQNVNPWLNIYYHGWLALGGAKVYLRARLRARKRENYASTLGKNQE